MKPVCLCSIVQWFPVSHLCTAYKRKGIFVIEECAAYVWKGVLEQYVTAVFNMFSLW